MSRAPDEDAGTAGAAADGLQSAQGPGGSAPEHPGGREVGGRVAADEDEAGAGGEPGDRSPSARGSVRAQRTGPGSTTTSALQRLARDLQNDQAVVDCFVADYLGLLDGRLAKLSLLLGNRDGDAAVVVLLSLETTSAMIGATEVVASARELREAIDAHQQGQSEQALVKLTVAVSDVREALACQGYSATRAEQPV